MTKDEFVAQLSELGKRRGIDRDVVRTIVDTYADIVWDLMLGYQQTYNAIQSLLNNPNIPPEISTAIIGLGQNLDSLTEAHKTALERLTALEAKPDTTSDSKSLVSDIKSLTADIKKLTAELKEQRSTIKVLEDFIHEPKTTPAATA